MRRIGIDLGTSQSRVYVQGRGLILDEPTMAVVQKVKGSKQPIKEGVIASFAICEAVLKLFIYQSVGRWWRWKPEVVLAVPVGSTPVERRAMKQAARGAGAKQAWLIETPMAAAIGAELPINEVGGCVVISLGAGVSEAAVISMNGVIAHASEKFGGVNFDEAIEKYLKKNKNIVIGQEAVAKLKKKITLKELDKEIVIKGRDTVTGLPRVGEITSKEMLAVNKAGIMGVVSVVKKALTKVLPELASDIIDRGMAMTGGMSRLAGLAQGLTKETDVPAYVVEEPELAVIKGIGIIIENWEKNKHLVS